MRLTVAIIARDEERHIGACLESVADLADEALVLLDARTTDQTAAIAAAYGARVVCEPWRGFPAQRNRALQLSRAPWVLFLDADERVTPELATELRTLLAAPPTAVGGYRIPRHNLFFGRLVRGGGWYPDYQTRLLRRDAASYDERRHVHEVPIVNGPIGTLRGHLVHINIERLDELWVKQSRYALAQAHTLLEAGRRSRWRNFLGAPAREFWRRYVALGGWRDGALGLFLCAAMAWFEVVTFAFLAGLGAVKDTCRPESPRRLRSRR